MDPRAILQPMEWILSRKITAGINMKLFLNDYVEEGPEIVAVDTLFAVYIN